MLPSDPILSEIIESSEQPDVDILNLISNNNDESLNGDAKSLNDNDESLNSDEDTLNNDEDTERSSKLINKFKEVNTKLNIKYDTPTKSKRNNGLTDFANSQVNIPQAQDIMSLLEGTHSNTIEDTSIKPIYSVAEDLSEIEDVMEAENNIEYYLATTDDAPDAQMDTLHDAMVLCLSKKNILILHLVSGIYYEKFVKNDCPACKRGGYIPSGTKEFINNLFHNGGDSINKRFGGINV
jgi:hypothetical protein